MKKMMSAAVGGAFALLFQAACAGTPGLAAPTSASPGPSPSPMVFGPIAPALVGTWTGTLQGSFGPGDLTMTLNADGTAWFEGTGRYCRVDGRWGASGTQFTASGGDCTGTVVTKIAPISSTILTGTWSASSGRSGTFSVTKQ